MMNTKKSKYFIFIIMTTIICLIVLLSYIHKQSKENLSFIGIQWTRTTEVDTEYLQFDKDNHFSYYCSCGNPIDNADMFSTYSYNPKTNTIILINDDDNYDDETIEVIEVQEKSLILKCDILSPLKVIDIQYH